MSRHPFDRIFAVLLPVVVIAHIVGAFLAPELLWGSHFYAFFPAWVLVIAVVALFAFVTIALRPHSKLGPALERLPDPERWPHAQRVLLGCSAAVIAGVVEWTFRIRHTLLGDGNAILLTLPRGDHFHPRQPLTVAWTAELYALARRLGPPNRPADESAQSAVAWASVIAGILFVPVAWGIAREIARVRGRGSERSPTALHPISVVWLTAGLLLAQGYMQLFFGYVENYTTYLLALALFVWMALRHLDGRAPLAAPILAAFLALGLHLSGGIAFPALVYLVIEALRRPDRRRAAWRDLGIAAVAIVALVFGLSRLGGGYDLFAAFSKVFREAVVRGGIDIGYAFSVQHLRDFLDEQLLIGPLGLFLFLPAVVFAARSGGLATPEARFLVLLAATYLGASWVAGDSNLGYARNWDLLAPGGLVFACAGLALLLAWQRERAGGQLAREPARSRRTTRDQAGGRPARPGPTASDAVALRPVALAAALALSIFHTAPWIAVNASPTRGVARVARLPLGGGRAQTAVGTWYMRAGDDTRALEWFQKALAEDPRNSNAYEMIGLVRVNQGHMEPAAEAFRKASALRPDKPEYRNNLVEALVQLGRLEEALPQYAWLCENEPDVFQHWQRRVEALTRLGRNDEARRVLEQARTIFARRQAARPNEFASNFDLGLVLLGLDRPADALSCFERALRADPASEPALYNVSAMLVRLGRGPEARPYVQRLLRSPDPGIQRQARAWMQQIGG